MKKVCGVLLTALVMVWGLGCAGSRGGPSMASYQKQLRAAEQQYGANHLKVVRPLTGVAFEHYKRGDFGKAEAMFRRAEIICEATGNDRMDHFAVTQQRLGLVYYARGKFDKAMVAEKKFASQKFGAMRGNSDAMAGHLMRVGLLNEKLGEYEAAELYLMRAERMFEKVVGKWSLQRGYAADMLAGLMRRVDRPGRAEEYAGQAWRCYQGAFGGEPEKIAAGLADEVERLRGVWRPMEADWLQGRVMELVAHLEAEKKKKK